MDLIQLVVLIIMVGLLLYMANRFIPMQGDIKQILNIVVVIVLVLYILSLFIGFLPRIPIGA